MTIDFLFYYNIHQLLLILSHIYLKMYNYKFIFTMIITFINLSMITNQFYVLFFIFSILMFFTASTSVEEVFSTAYICSYFCQLCALCPTLIPMPGLNYVGFLGSRVRGTWILNNTFEYG